MRCPDGGILFLNRASRPWAARWLYAVVRDSDYGVILKLHEEDHRLGPLRPLAFTRQ